MPEDRVTITADAGQYFDVLERAGAAGGRLARTGEDIGKGFFKGERVVESASRTITAGLLTAGDAGDAAALAVEGFSRTLKLPLVAGAGLTVAVTAMVALGRESAKTEKASADLQKQMGKTFSVQSSLSIADLGTEIQLVGKATDELSARLQGTGEKIVEFFQRQQFGFSQRPKLEADVAEGFARENALLSSQADAQRKINDLKETQLEQGKDAADQAKLLVNYENQIAKIQLNMPFGPPTEAIQKQLDNATKLLSVETAILGIEQSRVKQAGLLKQQQTEAQSATSFFEDVGSGKFRKDFGQEQQRTANEAAGRDIVRSLQDAKEKGILSNDPFTQSIVKEADRLAARQGTSVTDLANTDFSNLLELSKYDFSGLQPLNGLTLTIQ